MSSGLIPSNSAISGSTSNSGNDRGGVTTSTRSQAGTDSTEQQQLAAPSTVSSSANVAAGVATLTITETHDQIGSSNEEVMTLTLQARPSVTW